MSASIQGKTPYYYVPAESSHPVMAAIGLFFLILGAGNWVNGHEWGMYSFFFGLIWWLAVLFFWFSALFFPLFLIDGNFAKGSGDER